MLGYLETLVAFHPVSHDQNSVKRLLTYVGEHLERRGFKVELLSYNGVSNLYASPNGSKHSKILLQGHVDVVPGGQPFRIDGERAYGRGTWDMLFATAAYMKLADVMYEQDIACDIAFMLSGDEEEGGKDGVGSFLQHGYTTDLCILPDAGDYWGSLNVSAKGFYSPVVTIQGQAHHGSRPWEGDGAAIKLAHFLIEMEQLFDMSDQHNSTLTVSMLKAGHIHNQGPSEASATLDIRYKDESEFARILGGLETLLKKYNGTVTGLIDGSHYELNPDVPLVRQFIDMYEQHLGQPVTMTRAHGSSDARFFTKHDISVVSFQPDGSGRHSDEEWVSIPHFEKFYELLKDYVLATARV